MRHLTLLLVLFLSRTDLPLRAQDVTLPVKSGSVRFAAIGDMGTGEPAQYEVAQRMLQLHQKFPFTFVIMLGDNIYGGNAAADFEKKFELPYKLLLDAGVKFYASLGNHDAATQKTYKPFNMGGQQYYTYRKGNVQFFALDSNYMSPQQVAWLTKELESSKADWKICYFHHPLYSSAKFHGPSVELRQVLEPLFMKYGVEVVFSGHDHVYERTKPQNGIHYFIEGAAGELRKGDLKKTDLTAAGYDQDQSFLLVEISGDDLDFQAVSRLGVTIDQGSFSRNPELKP
jgi:predicted MPP superfamily phosphohydrolase